ncbi:ProP Permeases of the major facilitator superfamily [Candidatus Nanopelagicaceae bacterium]
MSTMPSWLSKVIHEDPIIRKVSLASLIDRFGNGLLISVLVIYFSFTVGLGPHQTALALSIGAAAGLLCTIPAGHLVDRVGQRVVVVTSMLVNGIAIFSLAFVHSFIWLTIAFALDSIANVFSRNAQQTLIARVGDSRTNPRNRAYTRSINNLGIGLGSLGAGIALAINSPFGYQVAIVLDALTFIFGAYIYTLVPHFPATLQEREKFDWSIFKDGRYIAASAMAAVTNIQFIVQNVGIPIWIVGYTDAPRWWVSAVLILNTTAVVLFQVKISKRTKPLKDSFNQYLLSGGLLAGACLLYASAEGPSARVASLFLLAGMALHVIAELLIAMIHWQISFDLAAESRQGAYYGIWTLGNGLSEIIGPSIVTFALVSLGKPGWAMLATMFILNALLYKLIVLRPKAA